MEENRLKPMAEGYDIELFKRLYKEVTPLKKKLAGQIDHNRFGVDHEEILSWFDVKFIFVFNKHQHDFSDDKLKAFILNAFQMFRYRVIRASYQAKYITKKEDIESPSILHFESLHTINPDLMENRDFKSQLLYDFMKETLSDEAYQVFQIQMTPPLFITSRMPDAKNFNKIPVELIAQYLDISTSSDGIDYINILLAEISQATKLAKKRFAS